MEAWLFGKPVIGCNIAPVSELIENNKNGLLVDYGNVKQLSESIIHILNEPSIGEQFGKEGNKKSLEYVSEKNFKLFEKKCIEVVNSFNDGG